MATNAPWLLVKRQPPTGPLRPSSGSQHSSIASDFLVTYADGAEAESSNPADSARSK